MKKPYRFDQMSGFQCSASGCRTMIKENLITRMGKKPELCYRHWWIKKAKRGTSLGKKSLKP